MLEIKIMLDASERLLAALAALSAASKPEPKEVEPKEPAPAQIPAPAPKTKAKKDRAKKEDQAPVPAPTPVPAPAPVPTSDEQTYTLEQISVAGAALIGSDPTTQADLMALLKKYDAPYVSALKPECFNTFAADLRELGADI